MLQKRKLLILSFITGFSVMVVELTAARIISPMFGNSIYTWTSAIGTVLLGTAIGSYFGGKTIDKNNKLSIISTFFLTASIFILYIPLIATLSKGIPLQNMPMWFSVVCASLSLFLIPSFLLGALYPMILKQFVQTIECVGQKSGLLSAGWSIGSIVGTFLTGFVFIGYIGSANTLLFISITLLLCSLCFHGKPKTQFLHLILYICISAPYFAVNYHKNANPAIVFNKESDYYNIRVVDGEVPAFGKTRVLLLDADSHSVESLSNETIDSYTNFYPVFSIFNKNIHDIAVIGGGSLALSNNFKDYYPEAGVTTAEIDPIVTKTAEKYFRTSDYIVKNTVPLDGRIFLAQSHQKYDVIFSDAYNSFISVPWHLTTREFFSLAKNKLNGDGVFAVNFISSQKGDTSDFYESMLATLSSVFDNYYVFAYGDNPTSAQSIVLVGINSIEHPSIDNLRSQLLKIPNGNRLALHLVNADNFSQQNARAIVFTDDFAPTDRLMMPVMNKYFQPYMQILYSKL